MNFKFFIRRSSIETVKFLRSYCLSVCTSESFPLFGAYQVNIRQKGEFPFCFGEIYINSSKLYFKEVIIDLKRFTHPQLIGTNSVCDPISRRKVTQDCKVGFIVIYINPSKSLSVRVVYLPVLWEFDNLKRGVPVLCTTTRRKWKREKIGVGLDCVWWMKKMTTTTMKKMTTMIDWFQLIQTQREGDRHQE